MEEAVKRLVFQLEDLEQQRHRLQLSLDSNQMTINSLNADIDGIPDEHKEQMKKQRVALDNKHKVIMKECKQEIQLLNEEGENVNEEKTALQRQFLNLQDQLIMEKNNSSSITYKAIDEHGLSMQIRTTREHNTNIALEVEELNTQIHNFPKFMERLEIELKEVEKTIEEKDLKVEELKDSLDCLCGEIQTLKLKLQNSKEEEMHHKIKGNSLFVEVEERRLLLKTKIPQLQKLCEHLENYNDQYRKQLQEVSFKFQRLIWDDRDTAVADFGKQYQESKTELNLYLQKLKELEEIAKSKLKEICFHFIIKSGTKDEKYLHKELAKKRAKVREIKKAFEAEALLVQASNDCLLKFTHQLRRTRTHFDTEKRNKKALTRKLQHYQAKANEEIIQEDIIDDLEKTDLKSISDCDKSELESFCSEATCSDSMQLAAGDYETKPCRPFKSQEGIRAKKSQKIFNLKERQVQCEQQ